MKKKKIGRDRDREIPVSSFVFSDCVREHDINKLCDLVSHGA